MILPKKNLKGVSSNSSGNMIVAHFFFELETSNLGYLLFKKFALTVQSFRKVGQT
jgi:hypothetical protein